MNKQDPRPLLLQRGIERLYPRIWDIAEIISQEQRGSALPDWGNLCFIPLPVWTIALMEAAGCTAEQAVKDAGALSAIGAWRLGKGVYRFDETLYNALIDTPIAENTPMNVFQRLPEYGLYIETPGLEYQGDILSGFFACYEYDFEGDTTDLRIVLDCTERIHYAVFALNDSDFKTAFYAGYLDKDSINEGVNKGLFGAMSAGEVIADSKALFKTMLTVLSLLLYLCSDAPDYGDREPPTFAAPKKVKGGEKWFTAPGVKQWDIGLRIGAAIRKYRHSSAGSETGTSEGRHTPKRPYIRRAHWHGIWTGKRSEPEQRKFKLNWIPPIPVKMDDEDGPVVIRPIK